MLGKVSSLCRKKIEEERIRPYIAPLDTNLDVILQDIYKNYIAINDEDFRLYYRVVQSVFLQMHRAMKETGYYGKYSSRAQYAGSHADNLRIGKPDEFDIDIVIGVPLNIKQNPHDYAESDFVLQPQDPGYVQLKMGVQYQQLPKRFRTEWQENSAPTGWGDEKHYLQSSKFMDWFKSVIDKALNKFRYKGYPLPMFSVDDYWYTVRKSESGPAVTLYIEDLESGFKLDVDLVPGLQFPVDRWPICSKYRPIPKWWRYPRQKQRGRRKQTRTNTSQHNAAQCSSAQNYAAPRTSQQAHKWRRGKEASAANFMVVSKPNKKGQNPQVKKRSWRLAMQDQERMLMHDTKNMRQAIRFMKQFRDAQGMEHIKSYYIKTMFFWEAMLHDQDRDFWDNSPRFLFTHMLHKFKHYLDEGKLPHFWHRGDNLLEDIPVAILRGYSKKVSKLLKALEGGQYWRVPRLLLTYEEYKDFRGYQ